MLLVQDKIAFKYQPDGWLIFECYFKTRLPPAVCVYFLVIGVPLNLKKILTVCFFTLTVWEF